MADEPATAEQARRLAELQRGDHIIAPAAAPVEKPPHFRPLVEQVARRIDPAIWQAYDSAGGDRGIAPRGQRPMPYFHKRQDSLLLAQEIIELVEQSFGESVDAEVAGKLKVRAAGLT